MEQTQEKALEEIEVNGKKYVLKDDYQRPRIVFCNDDETLHNKFNTQALGRIKLEGDWIATRISMCYLKTAIEILEKLEPESVDIVFRKDYPIIIGKINDKRDEVSGIITAPRVIN